MQSTNASLTPPSSASSSSSLSSSSSSSSINNSSSSSSKKYKRKSNGTFHSNFSSAKLTQNLANTSSTTNTATPTSITKPFYSEYLNSKCIINVYFKGDILSAIDDHFNKSFSLKSLKSNQIYSINNSNNNNNNSNNTNVSYQNEFYWSPSNSNSLSNTSNTNKLAAVAAVAAYLPNFNSSTDQLSLNGAQQDSIWPYYQSTTTNQQFYEANANSYSTSSSATNPNNYDNSWNRQAISNYHSSPYQFYDTTSSTKLKTKEIKEEPIINFNSDQIYSNQSVSANSYTNLASLDYNNNRYPTQYFDATSKQYSSFDLNNLTHLEAQTSNHHHHHHHQLTNNLRDTTSYVATTTPVYNY